MADFHSYKPSPVYKGKNMDVSRESTYPGEIVSMMGAPTNYVAYLTAGGREMALGGSETETGLVTELQRWKENKEVYKLIKDDIRKYEKAVQQRVRDSVVTISTAAKRKPQAQPRTQLMRTKNFGSTCPACGSKNIKYVDTTSSKAGTGRKDTTLCGDCGWLAGFDGIIELEPVPTHPQTPTPAAPKPKKQPAARKPAPDMPPILTAPPELTADVLGTGPMGLTPTAAPKRKPAARTTKPKAKKTAAKTRKPKKPAAKPKPKTKKTAAAPRLTASQREYLAIQGFVMVKRGGKYVRITG